MAYPGLGPPRRASGAVRYIVLAAIIVTVLYYYRDSAEQAAANSTNLLSEHPPSSHTGTSVNPQKPNNNGGSGTMVEIVVEGESLERPSIKPSVDATPSQGSHPIDALMQVADRTFDDLMKKESHDLNTAAAEYRKRRGRHPPPGFDKWYEFARQNGAVMVEDFFDQIYHDLGPFWGLPPATLRKESWDYDMVINIRNNNASAESSWFWTQIWLNMTQTIEHLLPDMDIPLNAMDEPRILVPWEQINKYMELERKSRKMPPAKDVISEFQRRPEPGKGDLDTETRKKDWEESSTYATLRTRYLLMNQDLSGKLQHEGVIPTAWLEKLQL